MNTSVKLTAGSILATAAVVVSSAAAFAGEGGAAGSVAIILNGGNPTQVSTSMATGKNSAAAAARTDGNGNSTYTSAIGGAGALQVTDGNTANVGYGMQADSALNTAQANELTGGSMSNGSVTLPGAEFPPAAPTPTNR